MKNKFNDLNEMVKQMKKQGNQDFKDLKIKLDDTNEELIKKTFDMQD